MLNFFRFSQWLLQFQKVKLQDLNNNVEITEIQPANSFFLTETHSLMQLLALAQSCQS